MVALVKSSFEVLTFCEIVFYYQLLRASGDNRGDNFFRPCKI